MLAHLRTPFYHETARKAKLSSQRHLKVLACLLSPLLKADKAFLIQKKALS
ncbi:hypothetical protein JCM21738_2753 [Mesobacillus boroniphilus JCM 21738]|uniref:Uncharacterized protein n=1 Tax=Mesobacillus boroniphilus JCM 21738 TaxID=1294265 RepID=W4RQN9_9BACI|nr:hypothetical protein JCM21738_2753 [Mesobacillus boroniphilus JCM 21738]